MPERNARRALLDLTEEVKNLDPKFTRRLGVFNKTALQNDNTISISNVSKLLSDGRIKKPDIPSVSHTTNNTSINRSVIEKLNATNKAKDTGSSTSITDIRTFVNGSKQNKEKHIKRISSIIRDSGLQYNKPSGDVPVGRKNMLFTGDASSDEGDLTSYLRNSVDSICTEDLLLDYKQVISKNSLNDQKVWTITTFTQNSPTLKLVHVSDGDDEEGMFIGLGIFKNEYEVLKKGDRIVLGNYKLKGYHNESDNKLDIYYRWKKVV